MMSPGATVLTTQREDITGGYLGRFLPVNLIEVRAVSTLLSENAQRAGLAGKHNHF